jgi:hypothetical protein
MKQLTNHWRIHNSKRIKDFVVSIVAKVAVQYLICERDYFGGEVIDAGA